MSLKSPFLFCDLGRYSPPSWLPPSPSRLHAVPCTRGASTQSPAAPTPHRSRRRPNRLLDGGGGEPRDPPLWRDPQDGAHGVAAARLRKGPGDGGDEDAAPATKKKAAAKKKRAPARASPAQRQAQRISRELTDFVENPPAGCKVSVGKNLNVWIVTMTGAEGTIFAGEKYKLRVSFPATARRRRAPCGPSWSRRRGTSSTRTATSA